MNIMEYGFNSINPITKRKIDESHFKNLSSNLIFEILKNKDKLLSRLDKPTSTSFQYLGLDYVKKIKVCKNGIKINLYYEKVTLKEDEYEEANIYIFEDGEVSYVPSVLLYDDMLLRRKDDVIFNLDEKIGKAYELKKERKGVIEKVLKTKEYNEKLIKLCKEKFDLVLNKSSKLLSDEKRLIMKVIID